MGTNKWEIKVQKEKDKGGRGWINIDSIFYQYLTIIIPQEQEGIILILQRPFLYEFLYQKSYILKVHYIVQNASLNCKYDSINLHLLLLLMVLPSQVKKPVSGKVSQPQLCHAHFWGRNMVISKCGSSEIRQTIKMNLILTKDGVSQSTKPFTRILILRPNIFLSSF